MAVDFRNSETKDNLMRAFAGESQARNRYTFGAKQARKAGQPAIAQVFEFTANQEKAHAEIFYKHLAEMAGESICVDGEYPVDITEDLGELLRMAQHNEYQEHDDVYKKFGDKAREEGYEAIAHSFHMIGEIEKVHGDRFGRFAQWFQEKNLHASDQNTTWICLNCGYICETTKAPERCPVCREEQGYFVRLEQAPFTEKGSAV